MEFEIPGKNLRLFAKTVGCLSKIGNEVFIEGREDRLILRALNASRSAFAGVTLHRAFFDSYRMITVGGGGGGGGSETAMTTTSSGGGLACKFQVKLKPICAVFKPAALGQADRCSVSADPSEGRITFAVSCKHGVKKRYRIAFDEECEALEARYDTSVTSHLCARPRVFIDCLTAFRQTSADEITFVLPRAGGPSPHLLMRSSPTPFSAPSSSTDQSSSSSAVFTELALDQRSLDEYAIESPSSSSDGTVSLTFSLKDFKHICGLCDAVGQQMTLQVTKGGQPAVITTKWFNAFEAAFVLATLIEQQSTPSSTQQTSGSRGSGPVPPLPPAAAVKVSQQHQATPATASGVIKKRPPSPHIAADEDESATKRRNMAADSQSQQQPAILPQGRLFVGDAAIPGVVGGGGTVLAGMGGAPGRKDVDEDEMDVDQKPDDETVPASCPK